MARADLIVELVKYGMNGDKTKFKKTGGSRCKRKCQKYRQRIALPMKIKYVFFYCSRRYLRLFVWLSLDCVN